MKTTLDAQGIEFQTKQLDNKRLTMKEFFFCAEWLEDNYIRHDRYTLLEATFGLYRDCERTKNINSFFTILGFVWQSVDNIAQYAQDISYVFVRATQKQQQYMMNDRELAEWKKLPDILTAYRFCYANNIKGYCYGTTKEEAELFSVNRRYQQEGNQKLIVTATMPKAYAILKLGREEEIIATRLNTVKVIKKHKLTPEENELIMVRKHEHHKAEMAKLGVKVVH